MAISYPTSLDTFTNPMGSDPVTSPDHATQHADANDAIEALEAKVGIGSATPDSGKVLRGTVAGTSTWGALDLTTDVTGVLPVANGGTGGATAGAARTALGLVIGTDVQAYSAALDAVSGTNTGDEVSATASAEGIVELATQAEVDAGTDAGRVVTPDTLAGSDFGKKVIGIIHTPSDTAVATGDGTEAIPISAELNTWDVTDVIGVVHTKGITGTTDIQIRRRRAGSDADVLSTKVTIADEWYANDGVINASNDDLQTGDALYVDVDAVHSGTAPNGLSVAITCEKVA